MIQTKALPDLVNDISLVAEMEQMLCIYKCDKCRRAGGCLGEVVNLEPAALVAGRLHTGRSARQHLVQHTGGHTGAVLGVYVTDKLHQLVDIVAGLRRNKDNRRIAHKAEALCIAPALLLHGVCFLAFHSVPLIDNDDAGLALLMGVAGHLAVLLRKADGAVHQDQRDTAALHSCQSADNHIALQPFRNIAAPAQAGCVCKDKFAVCIVNRRIYRIPRCTGLIGNDHTVFA